MIDIVEYRLQKAKLKSEDILKEKGLLYLNKSIDIVSLVKEYGFGVFKSSELEKYNMVAILTNFDDKKILISSKFDSKILKFLIAHIFGHYMLECNNSKNYYHFEYASEDNYLNEKLANIFAVNLIMPKDQFLDKYFEYRNFYYSDKEIFLAMEEYFNLPYKIILNRYSELINEENVKKKVITKSDKNC